MGTSSVLTASLTTENDLMKRKNTSKKSEKLTLDEAMQFCQEMASCGKFKKSGSTYSAIYDMLAELKLRRADDDSYDEVYCD